MIKKNVFDKDFKKILEKAIDYLKNEQKINTVILFGSYARGDYSLRHSDIDLYILIDSEKNFAYEKLLWKKLNQLSNSIQIHLSFDYNSLNNKGSLLRYNILKEGKILYEKSKSFFLKDDFDIEEVYLVHLDLSLLKSNEKFNFKRIMTKKHNKNVYYYDSRTVIIKKDFINMFHEITENKNVRYDILFEFLYRPKKDYDEF